MHKICKLMGNGMSNNAGHDYHSVQTRKEQNELLDVEPPQEEKVRNKENGIHQH